MRNKVSQIGEIESTPFFLVDEYKILQSVALIKDSLSQYWPNSVLSYSVKTNSMPCILRVLARLGVWAEVVSEYEYKLSMACGFDAERCICNGPFKSKSFINTALNNDAILNLDGLSEVNAVIDSLEGRCAKIGVRINATESDFPVEALCGSKGSRFGLSVRDGEMDDLLNLLSKNPNVTLTALHLHCNTRNRSVEGFSWLASFFSRLIYRYGLTTVDTFDIGGSFGHDFDCAANKPGRWPTWDDYFKVISKTLKQEGFDASRLRLVIEPGSALISNAAEYYATIVGRRVFDGRLMMQMDGSRIHIDPHFARTSFKDGVSLSETHAGSNSLEAKLICGSSCLEKDRVEFGDANFKCAVGDRIVFNKAGAYTYGMSPLLFIQPSPDVWLKKTNGDIMLVHKKMLFEEIGHLMEGKN